MEIFELKRLEHFILNKSRTAFENFIQIIMGETSTPIETQTQEAADRIAERLKLATSNIFVFLILLILYF